MGIWMLFEPPPFLAQPLSLVAPLLGALLHRVGALTLAAEDLDVALGQVAAADLLQLVRGKPLEPADHVAGVKGARAGDAVDLDLAPRELPVNKYAIERFLQRFDPRAFAFLRDIGG